MFDIGWSELVVIGIVALIVIGPKELPATLRALGQGLGKVRRMASEFQGQFQDAMREAELDELRKQAEKMSHEASSAASFDPIGEVKSELRKVVDAPEKPAPATEPVEAAESPEPETPVPETQAPQSPALDAPKDPPAEPSPDSAADGGRPG